MKIFVLLAYLAMAQGGWQYGQGGMTIWNSGRVEKDFKGDPEIVYKTTDHFEWSWSNYQWKYGTKYSTKAKVWKISNDNVEYCALGDVTTKGTDNPTAAGILVKDVTDERYKNTNSALKHPTSFRKIWSSTGTSSYYLYFHVDIYEMVCPDGYKSLGSVAERTYLYPKTTKYCCVHKDLLTEGEDIEVWNSKGGGTGKMYFHQIIRGDEDLYGLEGSNFVAVTSSVMYSPKWLLKHDNKKVFDLFEYHQKQIDKPIHIYEVSELKKVFEKSESGKKNDMSIWDIEEPPTGYVRISQIAIHDRFAPGKGYMAKKTDALKRPTGSIEIASRKGVKIFKLNCPPGHVALSNYATTGSRPDVSKAPYCVNKKYLKRGNEANVETIDDYFSGSNHLYGIVSYSYDMLSVRGYEVKTHKFSPRLLDRNEVNYFHEKPCIRIEILNIYLDTPKKSISKFPASQSSGFLENHDSWAHSVEHDLKYTKSRTVTMGGSIGIEIGVTTTASAGIPGLFDVEQSLSWNVNTEFSWGNEKLISHEESIKAKTTVQPRTKLQYTIRLEKKEGTVPFTAKVRKHYTDGTSGESTISGEFRDVQTSQAVVVFGASVPMYGATNNGATNNGATNNGATNNGANNGGGWGWGNYWG